MAGEAEPPRYKDTGHAAPGYCQRVIAAGAQSGNELESGLLSSPRAEGAAVPGLPLSAS
jgi:hypothetical protein